MTIGKTTLRRKQNEQTKRERANREKLQQNHRLGKRKSKTFGSLNMTLPISPSGHMTFIPRHLSVGVT